jgi:Family of unknown function (DUF6011)
MMYSTFAPIPALAELRLAAIEASEKRMPYWRFRLSPNIVLKLQPKLMWEGPNARLLDASYKDLVHPHWRFGFEVTAQVPKEWRFHRRSASWSGPQRYDMPREHNMAKVAELRERVVAAFRDGWFNVIGPEMMLSQHCLICGKGLTDPVSMARFIGPECASKEYAPRVLRLFAEAVV